MKNTDSLKQYWKKHFEQMLKLHPFNHADALNYSNNKLLNQIHNIILERIVTKSNVKILDAGCGLGDLAVKIYSQRNTSGLKIFNIDISELLLKEAKKYVISEIGEAAQKCEFSCQNLTSMSFRDNFFDISIAAESLQYTDDYHKSILELIRVTKKTGNLIVSFPNKENPVIKKAEVRNKGKYKGIDLLEFLDFLNKIGLSKTVKIKPLIFASDQSRGPYRNIKFKARLTNKEVEQANRFVVDIKL